MTADIRPQLVLVHGAWHGPQAWDLVAAHLTGVDTHAVSLPSAGGVPSALADMHSDAAVVQQAVREVMRDRPGSPVTVVAHSYAGIPVTQALAADERDPGGTGVSRMVFVSAFLLDAGESLISAVGGEAPPWWSVHPGEGYLDPLDPVTRFYHDVRDPELIKTAISRLRHQSWPSFTQPLTRAAWRDLPSTFVVLGQDRAIPVPAQEAMAQRATRIRRMDTSHSPFLSQPAQLAELILEESAWRVTKPV